MTTAEVRTNPSPEDLELVERVDSAEKRILETVGTMTGCAVGLGSIVSAFLAPEIGVAAAVAGLVIGLVLPRLSSSHRR
jgi:hypothetical protein